MKNKTSKFNFRDLCKVSLFSIVIATLLLLTSRNSIAQQRWSVEFRPGVNITTSRLGNVSLNTGYGLEGTVSYRFMPHLGAYAGWSWNKFASDNGATAGKLDFEETGYNLGLRFVHPIGSSKTSILAKGGATYNHIETENTEGKIIDDSGHGVGWQIGGGVAITLGKHWQLLPEARYRSLSRSITVNGAAADATLNYISIGVGVSYSF